MAKIVKIEKGFLTDYIHVENDNGEVIKYSKDCFKGRTFHVGQKVEIKKGILGSDVIEPVILVGHGTSIADKISGIISLFIFLSIFSYCSDCGKDDDKDKESAVKNKVTEQVSSSGETKTNLSKANKDDK